MLKYVKSVLIVDDDEDDILLHKETFDDLGMSPIIYTAKDGLEALEMLKTKTLGGNSDYMSPDLMILDINMPRMNGIEFLAEYKKLPAIKKSNVVIMMVTTSSYPEDKNKALKSGIVQYYLNKPLTPNLLKEVLDASSKKVG